MNKISNIIAKHLLDKLTFIAQLHPTMRELLFSNLALPLNHTELLPTFKNFKHLLKADGLLLFSTLGPDTLQELSQNFTASDYFIDMHNIGDYLLQTGFSMPVMEMEKITMIYHHMSDLVEDLKMLGLDKLITADKCLHSTAEKLSITYEVIYGHAWQAALTHEVPVSTTGETMIPISKITRNSQRTE
jgi:malonyl-CoA O-methyltransferase